MVVTRSKTTLKEPVDTHTALEKELSLFSSHSLSWFVRFAPQRGTRPDIRTLFSVSWAAKPRHNTKSLSRGADQSNAKLLSLPLDVLATIFTYCHPTSLLQLSRTSHALHSFLTSRGSTSIWVSARKARTFTVTEEDKALVGNDSHYSSIAVGTWELPRCPSYMSEAAYAALLYIEICSFCQMGKGCSINICLNARICGSCHEKDFVSVKHLTKLWAEEADARLFRMLPWNASAYGAGKIAAGKKAYHLPTCQAIFDRAVEFEMIHNFNAPMMAAFYDRGAEEILERLSFGREYEAFEEGLRYKSIVDACRKQQQHENRYERNCEVAVRLFREKDLDCLLSDIKDSSMVNNAVRYLFEGASDIEWRNLRDRYQDEVINTINCRYTLEKFYKPESTEFRELVRPRHLMLMQHEDWPFGTFPRFADFLEMPTIVELANSTDFSGPASSSKRDTLWEEAIPRFVEDAKQLRKSMQEDLLAKLELSQAFSEGQTLTEDDLSRPDAIFTCSACPYWASSAILYPAVLTHPCFTKYKKPSDMTHTRNRMMQAGIAMHETFSSETDLAGSRHLNIASQAIVKHQALNRLVAAAGETPPKTKQAFRNFRGLFTCQDCHDTQRIPKTYTQALAHHNHTTMRAVTTPKGKIRRERVAHTTFTFSMPLPPTEGEVSIAPPLNVCIGEEYEYPSDWDEEVFHFGVDNTSDDYDSDGFGDYLF